MKKRTINMKKSLAIAVAAAMMLGICPTAAPVNAADSDYKYVYAVWTGQSTGRMKMFIWQAEVH